MEINYTVHINDDGDQKSIPLSIKFHDHNVLECGSDDEAAEEIASLVDDHFRMNMSKSFDMKFIREEVRRIRELHGMPE